MLAVDALGDSPRQLEVGLARLDPDEVGVLGVGVRAAEHGGQPRLDLVEALGRAATGEEGLVAVIHIARDEVRGERVGAGDDHGGHVGDVGGQPRRRC